MCYTLYSTIYDQVEGIVDKYVSGNVYTQISMYWTKTESGVVYGEGEEPEENHLKHTMTQQRHGHGLATASEQLWGNMFIIFLRL